MHCAISEGPVVTVIVFCWSSTPGATKPPETARREKVLGDTKLRRVLGRLSTEALHLAPDDMRAMGVEIEVLT